MAAANPLYVSEDEVDEQAKEAELRVLREQAAGEGKPENVQEKIVEGRLKKWLEDVVLMRPDARERGEARRQDDRRACAPSWPRTPARTW